MSPNSAHAARPAPRSRLETLASFALITLAIGAVGVLLFVGRAAFVPVVFALLFALVLSTPVEALHQRGIPRSLGALFILLIVVGLAAFTMNAVWAPARDWVATIPRALTILEQRAGPMAHAMEQSVFGTTTDARITGTPGTGADFTSSASGNLMVATPSLLTDVVTIVMLTLFLLGGGAPMAGRVAATLSSEGQSVEALRIIGAVRSEVARYYATVAFINLGLGIAVGALTAIIGLPNPVLWGTLAAILNFIPYVGSATTLVVLSMVAFVTFDSFGRVLALVVSFLILVTIEGQIVEPLLIGKRLKLSPIVVFLALWFGGWFWGVAGIFLAIPTLVALKVVAEQSKNGRVVVELLSPTPRRRFKALTPGADERGPPPASGEP